MRKLEIYVAKYGPVAGPRLFHLLQSQAAHAGVGARLRRKLAALADRGGRDLPLFPAESAAPAGPEPARASA